MFFFNSYRKSKKKLNSKVSKLRFVKDFIKLLLSFPSKSGYNLGNDNDTICYLSFGFFAFKTSVSISHH